jgi:hypothetical protein
MMAHEWIPMTLTLWLQLTACGVEKDGTVNHLLETEHKYSTQYSISISKPRPLYPEIKAMHTWFLARVEMECQNVWAMDEIPGQEFGSPRQKYICNATTLEVLK